jgi:aminopeptidase N
VLLDTLIVALPHESDELVLQHMLARAIALFWRFTRRDGRPVVAGTLEPVLRTGLDRSASKAVRAAWFNALRTVAITPATIAWLERIWRRDEIVDGLPMSESDETTLACELAIRGVGDAPEVVARQLARIRNPDRRARLAFIAPALSSDETVRDTFFAQLREPSARSREAWVVDAARYLHHPLRADASRRYVVPALDLLPEIQRTGDIFFPKRWADATLDGHADARVADDVRAYVDGLPGEYPERLRWILLSSADSLFRAARIVSAGP